MLDLTGLRINFLTEEIESLPECIDNDLEILSSIDKESAITYMFGLGYTINSKPTFRKGQPCLPSIVMVGTLKMVKQYMHDAIGRDYSIYEPFKRSSKSPVLFDAPYAFGIDHYYALYLFVLHHDSFDRSPNGYFPVPIPVKFITNFKQWLTKERVKLINSKLTNLKLRRLHDMEKLG